MKIIGLTGGIGSGKSTVLKLFKNLGIRTYSADISAKQLVNSDEKLIDLIKTSFGNNIYKDNILDSKKLSKIVFGNTEKLKLLNSIIHPVVALDFKNFLEINNDDYIVKEAAIIFETKSESNYDKIILIRSPLEVRIERVMNRDSLSRLEVMKRINNQLDENSIIDKCDYIINNQNIKNLKDKVLSIHLELKG
ncbi:MAG: dephospho-CoA kinase [Cryomorphaceae bacterium]|jgi:dephospho-CoA kinase|nr:dephospho-CoA kinase [Cryomorphaceae bacterium]MDG1889062.1 dephospho-CoA kinase [Flavobacteriaceae bacterium]MBT3503148.1 dephospho-CoA kinase [Cryomorphaceae bacterium]MBT3689223.1 dephospho-CoA kinase [Cryomorphaceae bacterium]MBT4222053.1 dephospho-CoA kinase [Cryomorphaceae bacterium]|tara:strand:- start:1258 stop:1836 length:579 start_codon:yes stop_codon:yes gene_type:complete